MTAGPLLRPGGAHHIKPDRPPKIGLLAPTFKATVVPIENLHAHLTNSANRPNRE
jgi:hypothetical protein